MFNIKDQTISHCCQAQPRWNQQTSKYKSSWSSRETLHSWAVLFYPACQLWPGPGVLNNISVDCRPVLSRGQTIEGDCNSCCSQCSDDLVTVLEMVSSKVSLRPQENRKHPTVIIPFSGGGQETFQSYGSTSTNPERNCCQEPEGLDEEVRG